VSILWPDGRMERPKPIKTTAEAMRLFFTRPQALVVVYVGTHSRWVSALLEELGHQVTVANARRVKLISQSDSKSDQVDSELLARLGKADVKLLAPIRHRSMEAQSDLAVPKARDGLVGCRTKLINTCRGLVKSFGRRLPKCSAQTFHIKAKEQVPAVLKPALEPIFQALIVDRLSAGWEASWSRYEYFSSAPRGTLWKAKRYELQNHVSSKSFHRSRCWAFARDYREQPCRSG